MEYIGLAILPWYTYYLNNKKDNKRYATIAVFAAIFATFLSLLYVLKLLGII